MILATGFGETGARGKALENDVLQVAGQHHIRLIGPNTSGMINLKDNLNLVGLRDSPKGDIALLTQSGNMALTLITEAKLKSRKGFTYYVAWATKRISAFTSTWNSSPGPRHQGHPDVRGGHA